MPVRRHPAARRGFTMVEMAAAVAVAGIVVSVALPTWRDSQLRSRRVDATTTLLRLQALQEEHRLRHGGYAENLASLPGAPQAESALGRYRLELHPLGREGYELRALAQGPQAADSACATVTLRIDGALSFPGPDPRCWHS